MEVRVSRQHVWQYGYVNAASSDAAILEQQMEVRFSLNMSDSMAMWMLLLQKQPFSWTTAGSQSFWSTCLTVSMACEEAAFTETTLQKAAAFLNNRWKSEFQKCEKLTLGEVGNIKFHLVLFFENQIVPLLPIPPHRHEFAAWVSIIMRGPARHTWFSLKRGMCNKQQQEPC